MNGESKCMAWPTLGPRTPKEQNRTLVSCVRSFKPIAASHRTVGGGGGVSPVGSESSSLAGLFSSTGGDSTPTLGQRHHYHHHQQQQQQPHRQSGVSENSQLRAVAEPHDNSVAGQSVSQSVTHTHTFNGSFSRTTRVSRYQKDKTNLDFTEARDSEWQWHQLGDMQVCT